MLTILHADIEDEYSKMLLACTAYRAFVSSLYPDDTSPLPVDRGPVKLLSIDNAGVHGLSSLLLLQRIMEQTNAQRQQNGLEKQEPWEMFEMMAGTGTGG
jgi:hypothetical protein